MFRTLVGAVAALAVGAALVTACGDGEPAAEARTWLLPASLLERPVGSYQVGEVDGALWPPDQTISLWRAGDEWVLTHWYPLPPDNVLGTIPPLGLVFGEATLPPAESVATPGVVPEPADGDVPRELWFYASPGIDERLLGAVQAGLREDPAREQMGAPLTVYADDDGNYDAALRERVEAVALAGRAELPWVPGVQAVFAFGDDGSTVALASPIPLDVLPVEVTEVDSGDGYEVHHTAGEALVVRDGGIEAVIRAASGADRSAWARTVAEVGDLNWGEWAWPGMGARLRLADLSSSGRAPETGCSAVITLDGGCHEDLTPDTGFEWPGGAPSLAAGADGSWTARLPLDRLPAGVAPPTRLGVVRQNQVVLEFDAADVPGVIEATFPTRRAALQALTMLYPDEPFIGGDS